MKINLQKEIDRLTEEAVSMLRIAFYDGLDLYHSTELTDKINTNGNIVAYLRDLQRERLKLSMSTTISIEYGDLEILQQDNFNYGTDQFGIWIDGCLTSIKLEDLKKYRDINGYLDKLIHTT